MSKSVQNPAALVLIVAIAIGLPYLPGRDTRGAQVVELLFILESVHAGPESIVGVADQLLLRNQPMKRLNHQFLFVADVAKNVLFENEKPAVNSYIAVANGVNVGNQAAIAFFNRDEVITEVRPDTKKAGNLALVVKMVQLLRKGQVGQPVAIVRQELVFSVQVFLNRFQALTNIGVNSRIRECNAPIVNIAIQ